MKASGFKRDFLAEFRQPSPVGAVLRFGLAIVMVAATVALQLVVAARLGHDLPVFAIFYPVVLVVALAAGFRPAMLATALAGLSTWYWFLAPYGQFAIASPTERISLAIFVGMGLLISAVAKLYRNHRDARFGEALRYQAELLDNVSDAVISTDQTLRIKSWNKAAEEIYGWPAAEAIGKNPDELLRAEYLGIRMPQLEEQLLRQGSAEADAHHHDRRGRKRVVRAMLTPIRNAKGETTGTLYVFHDVTESKLAEDALRDSVVRFRLALRNSPVSVAIQDRQLVYQWAYNPQARRPDEIIGKTDADWLAPEDIEPIHAVKRRVLESGTEENLQLWLTSNGTRMFLNFHFEPMRDAAGEISGIGITTINLTNEKLSEESLRVANKATLNILQDSELARQQAEQANAALHESEAAELARRTELETLMDTLPIAVCIAHDPACLHITGNPAACALLRTTTHGSNISKSAANHDLIPAHEFWSGGRRLAAHELPIERAATTGRAVHNVELSVHFSDGVKRQIIGNAIPLFAESGAVRGVVATFINITKRKHTQVELKRLNRTLRALNDSNRALRDSPSETELLPEVCRIVTQRCGHAMVWIGYAENDPAKTVRPVASVGPGSDYLDTMRVSWADTANGRGPGGTAIRSGQPQLCNDIATDPLFAPWRDEALKRGYASALGLPLLTDGKAFGAIIIFSRKVTAFSNKEIKLLASLADDLAIGITSIRMRSAQQQIEAEILTLNQQLETRVMQRTDELQVSLTALEVEISNRHRLEREILEISEREQCRLGQDLHDGLGQELAGIAMLGDVLAKQLQSHPSAQNATQIANHVRSAIDSTRRLAKGHYPIELDRYGLLLALKDLAAQTSRRTGICCEMLQDGADPQLEKSAQIHLYRIIQECISNAVKHARPTRITIESLAGDGRLTFAVTDDGTGFDPASAPSGMGLHLMDYRARVIGGLITFEQPAQGGSRITCALGDPI